jgi:hypothetical protein
MRAGRDGARPRRAADCRCKDSRNTRMHPQSGTADRRRRCQQPVLAKRVLSKTLLGFIGRIEFEGEDCAVASAGFDEPGLACGLLA